MKLLQVEKAGIVWGLCMVLMFAVVAWAHALDVVWDRNPEAEKVTKYHVYLCKVQGCVATDQGALWVGTVDQPALGVAPFYTLPVNTVGSVAVSAENAVGISPVSVPLNFTSVVADTPKVPSASKNLRLR